MSAFSDLAAKLDSAIVDAENKKAAMTAAQATYEKAAKAYADASQKASYCRAELDTYLNNTVGSASPAHK